jgi:hypothetical protein
MPVTIPEVLTVAMPVELLVQPPPLVVSVSEMVVDTHTSDDPEMEPAEGDELTVTTEVSTPGPQLLDTL